MSHTKLFKNVLAFHIESGALGLPSCFDPVVAGVLRLCYPVAMSLVDAVVFLPKSIRPAESQGPYKNAQGTLFQETPESRG